MRKTKGTKRRKQDVGNEMLGMRCWKRDFGNETLGTRAFDALTIDGIADHKEGTKKWQKSFLRNEFRT